MPIYEFKCKRCGELREIKTKPNDSKFWCRACGGKMVRTWGTLGVIFKGSGFYSTDNAK
jgi:putative FmdB family regulatory protein